MKEVQSGSTPTTPLSKRENITQFKKKCLKWGIYNKNNDSEKDMVCDICLDENTYKENDLIVICDGCNSATHQSCYGGPEKFKNFDVNNESEPWFCHRCAFLFTSNLAGNSKISPLDLKCDFCPDIQGIICKV